MAVSIPSGIYTLGAVQIDSANKLANLQGQLLAKKAAKEEALSKYFNDLRGKITPAGMRSIDLPQYNEKVQNWISNGIINKNEIAKGGEAYQKHLEDYQSLLNDAELSKQAKKENDEAAKLKLEDKIDIDLDSPILDSQKKSIYDKGFYKNYETRQPYTVADFSKNIPTWDIGKRKQFIDYATSDFEPRVRVNEKKIFDNIGKEWVTTYDLKHSDDDIRAMAERGIAVNSDEKGIKTYSEILKGHGDPSKNIAPTQDFIELSKAYNKYFPDDIMDTPQKVAAADIILSSSKVIKAGKPERVIDREAVAKLNAKYSKEGSATGQINLTTYPDVDDKKDVSNIFRGVKVTGLPKGESMAAKRILYNPSSNEVTVTEWVGRDSQGNPTGEQTTTLPYYAFLQNIKTLNPSTDFKYIETLPKAKTGKKLSSTSNPLDLDL